MSQPEFLTPEEWEELRALVAQRESDSLEGEQ